MASATTTISTPLKKSKPISIPNAPKQPENPQETKRTHGIYRRYDPTRTTLSSKFKPDISYNMHGFVDIFKQKLNLLPSITGGNKTNKNRKRKTKRTSKHKRKTKRTSKHKRKNKTRKIKK